MSSWPVSDGSISETGSSKGGGSGWDFSQQVSKFTTCPSLSGCQHFHKSSSFSVLCGLGFSEQQRGWDEETRSVMRWPDWPPRSVQPGTLLYKFPCYLAGENVPQPKYNLTPKSQILTPEVLLVVAPRHNITLRQFWQEFNTKTILSGATRIVLILWLLKRQDSLQLKCSQWLLGTI